MADDKMVLYTAVYDDVTDALADLDALDQLHDDEIIGKFDAAVIARQDGQARIVKRLDRPRIRAIPEALGSGTLRRSELKDAAAQLTGATAALIVAGEPTLEKGFDKVVTKTSKVVKRSLDATADEIANELQEAAKTA